MAASWYTVAAVPMSTGVTAPALLLAAINNKVTHRMRELRK